MSIVDNIVDRQHVSVSNLGVCRAVFKAIKASQRRDPTLHDERKKAYRLAIDRHKNNRDLYRYVMRGGH